MNDKNDSTMVKAAKAIGKAAGKVAALAGAHAESAAIPKKGKLPKKNKHRLPRREKKAQQRAVGRQNSAH